MPIMTPHRWKRLEEIYHSARAQDSATRAAYLAEACGGDEELRVQIESLLQHGDVLSKLESTGARGTVSALLTPGSMVGPYTIEERLDAGGMGVVYRATDTRLGRQVAIKIGLAQFSDRFHREARTVAALNHTNVCTLHDIGSTPEIPGYLVMEFVEGSTLASRLESGQLSITEALEIGRQVAAALASAHERGIVHRDLKPANVKITPQGVVKVLDFGLAKDFPAVGSGQVTATLTAAGTVMGTAAYMSPEQAAGKETDARSDIFSFGIVLYEMLTGRRAFAGTNAVEIMASVLNSEASSPRKWHAEIPEPVERIVLKCLQKSPEARYASGTELQRDLDALMQPEGGRFVSLRVAIAIAALVIVVVGGYFGYRHSNLRWLQDTAVPEMTRLLEQHRALSASVIYRQAARIAPDSKLLYTLAPGVEPVSQAFETTPSGAKLYISDYTAAAGDDLSEWQYIGDSPLTYTQLPNWGLYRLRAIKEGFAPADQVFASAKSAPDAVVVTLHAKGTVPLGMVWVPPAKSPLRSLMLPGFWIDRFEITNQQFLEFVKAGGYQKPGYWKEPFFKEGRPLSWEQAMSEFRDLTGRNGPANWNLGTFPEGTADYPVAGVSWYEAMAYSEFAGLAIPTVDEWRLAAPVGVNADVVLMSNFSGNSLSPVGKHRGMTSTGAYDMAGNVKEWTVNAIGTLRYTFGGSWDEANYVFSVPDARDPFWRTISHGFRTVKRVVPLPSEAFEPYQPLPGSIRTSKPADDATYRIYAQLHEYQPKELDSRLERRDNSSRYWTRETVSFNAAYVNKVAYANDRVLAHLFLPKDIAPPYQVIIVLGGSYIMTNTRVEDFGFPYEFLIRSGRAVMIPAFWGTLERGPSPLDPPENEEIDRAIKWSRDLGRSVDYLQTRSDIDITKLGFYGISWGAAHAPRLLAVDKRFKAAAFMSGGFLRKQPPQVDSWNFASHYRVPTLMVNGKQDFIIPYETNQLPFFNALGTPAADKKLSLYDGGHANPVTRPNLMSEILLWFDHYLGPAQQQQ
jgi:formylglycine-generating enzyme required for sulfatase activity/dienelactone hydrolase